MNSISNDKALQLEKMNESIINHLFLPHYLPSSADDDFLIKDNHENEYKLLDCMNDFFFNSLELSDTINSLPIFQILMDCIKRWSKLQNSQHFSVSNIQSTIEQLPSGSFLPLYFHTQNATILIAIDENNSDQPLISAWQVLLPNEEITSSLKPHLSCFPVTTYRLCDRLRLTSKVHCELLMDFMHNTVEYFKSYRSSREVNEIRDVPESHYVCQWWIQHFDETRIETNSITSVQFKKKHRDHIRWNKTLLPFRRSGLWMTIKVVLHTILTKHLKDIGTVVYKLLITHFLTYIICTKSTSIDLLIHCVRKIVRRLNKIEILLSSISLNDMSEWITYTKQHITGKIDEIISKSIWQYSITNDEKFKQTLSINTLKLDNVDIYRHSCIQLKIYININNLNEKSKLYVIGNNTDIPTIISHEDYIPSLNMLTKQMNYTIGISLTRIELWVESHLEQWINCSSPCVNGKNRFEILLNFFEEYQTEALNHYWSEKGPTDPMGYTRFILTSLTIIRCMHQKLYQDKRFERLKHHSIHIPNLLKLFEFLVLPTREDIIRANDLYHFLNDYNNKLYPDLLNDIESKNAFGVYFANHSSQMTDSIQRIRIQAEQEKQDKIKEVDKAMQRYMQLMNVVDNSLCEHINNRYNKRCKRCQALIEMNKIQVKIFECPIPSALESALAVIFELQMPIEIRCYRDILWQFVNRPKPHPQHQMYEWLSIPPHDSKLSPFYTGPTQCRVRLVSSTKSITQSHYSTPPSIESMSAEDFIFENSLKIQISPIQPIELEDECCILTPQLDHPDYKQLQFAINTTQFAQNHVISKLSDCSPRLKPRQFIEFGSFRSGHRLQWWNLLTIFEMDSLSIADENVAILIIHSILQYGPLTPDLELLSSSWCPESHQQLLEDHFVDELISRLDHTLDDCKLNWQNELVLIVITMITMRLLTICNSTKIEKIANLALKCRQLGENWIDLISISIETVPSSALDEVEKLRIKIVNVGIACVLTFPIHQDSIHYLLSSNEHVVSLLKAASTIHDNIILNKNQSDMSIFMRNIMRFSERVLVMMQPTVAEYLQKTSYQSLNDFTLNYWTIAKEKGYMNGQWTKRRNDPYDGWYDCQYESNYISIDCIRGTFLINGTTIGFLPENIVSNELFIRVFGNHMFEVQLADSSSTYVTKHSYHGTGLVRYEFHFHNRTNHLIIKERHKQTNDVFQLIPHKCFENELPDMFISNYSHWWNEKDQIIEFRPIHFKEIDFLNNKSYILSIRTGYVTTTNTNNTQTLINQSSIFFQNLVNRYFNRLDDKPYVYMMGNHVSLTNTTIHIHLSRLGIAFQYNTTTNIITSREYSDMCIDEHQWLGTLVGLTSGLLLSPLSINNHRVEQYPYRKLIVPFGRVHCEGISNINHQTVSIQRSSSISCLHHYFVFILNDRLKILQSIDSPAGWLYLALLHAMTSHPLPDQYTGITGMERAFQLLNSAGCWSDQPFDSLSLNILSQIASISPKANYYPEHLTCMEQIDWSSNGLPYSMQHFGYYLIAKNLIKTSQQLSFMYSPSTCTKMPKIFEEKLYNESLLKKLYWNYRDSYNSLVRLPPEMEENILSTSQTKSYQIAPKYCSYTINYTPTRLVDYLYKNGSVKLQDCSQQHWLPLSQWLNTKYQLRNIWIGLLKMINCCKTSTMHNVGDQIEQLEKLIDFLHYITGKLNSQLFYLQMLKTALNVQSISLTSIPFPPFIDYQNIEEIVVTRKRIYFNERHTSDEQDQIVAEVQDCFSKNNIYKDKNSLAISNEKIRINSLLASWQNNKKLRLFLESVQNRICSVQIKRFHLKVSYKPQQFIVESFKNHHQIQFKSTDKLIDQNLLRKAQQKFLHRYSGHFDKPLISIQTTTTRQNEFPYQIFSSANNHDNSLDEISNYFKNRLDKSWKKLFSNEQTQQEHPSIEEITEYLNLLREESIQSWNVLVESIIASNKQLFKIGLLTPITPTILISYFQQKLSSIDLSINERILFGGILVNWTLEQQLERALHYAIHDKWEDFTKEMSNIPHSNWIPSEHVSWLILELEMNITIRDIQIKVARHMMQPIKQTDDAPVKSIVTQMNMGEGKTSVILPMLAASLSSSNTSLVRIIVLKSLFRINYQSLKYKLGGLLNRHVFPFTCRRDLNLNDEQISQIFNRFKQALDNCDVILTSPEDIHSFDLLSIDKCRRNEFDVGRSMLEIQRWLRSYIRDILDESDEILHAKYQLIYTVGGQQQVDGGTERWQTIQLILHLVKKHAANISECFKQEVYYKSAERKSNFPQFRLQSNKPYSLLCKNITNDWLNQKSYRQADREIILSFILEPNSSIDHLLNKFSGHDIQLFLILRGLLSSEVLLVALKKRYRVNYGINSNPLFNRLMAVPFRAKDVAADRTEFGHPDIALVLTQLSYYYSGLNDLQLTECFNRLYDKESDPTLIYNQWISSEDDVNISMNIKQWKGVNLKDYQQRTHDLFPTFRYNILVVDYFLNYFVFPREAKQYPHKLVSSAWDLSSSLRSHIITGFSGTNDTKLLLPMHIRQYDLTELRKTDAIVVNNLLQPENENYQYLPVHATSNEILNQIVNYKKNINVILDVGALFIDGTNQNIAMKWLNLSNQNMIDYVVYFNSDSIVVCDRQYHQYHFETSPASERLDRCIFYLDEIHTRGTDFKFPNGFRAAVTLGNNLPKDRFVQACMRMRKLGNGHSLTFWSSNEVHQQITMLKKNQEKLNNINITVIDILRWVYENTRRWTWDGLYHWSTQSLSFQRKLSAFQTIDWNDHKQIFTNKMMMKLSNECMEPEIIDLKRMYGASKVPKTIDKIYLTRYQQCNHHLLAEIHDFVLKRLHKYGGAKQRLSQLYDEEQQRELEQELDEERQMTHFPPVKPCKAILHEEIKRLCASSERMNIADFPHVFRPLVYAFSDTKFCNNCQPKSWQYNFWVSTEFQRVIKTKGELLNLFLRPPRWIVVYQNQHIIFVNALEANWLMGCLNSFHHQRESNNASITTLRLLLPRIKQIQSIFVNTPTLTIPPSIGLFSEPIAAFTIPIEWLVQLFIFNGTLYFETIDEQTAYCQCLGLCPKPRTELEEIAFEKRWIAVDGFVNDSTHRRSLKMNKTRFHSNPLTFIKQLLENRNSFPPSATSHVGSIVLDSFKLL